MRLSRKERIDRSTSSNCPCCGGPLAVDPSLRVDLGTNTIYGHGVAVMVPPRHAELCYLLAEAWPNAVQRHDIVCRIWPHQDISDNLLKATIHLTRRYVERVGFSIKNEFGLGYRLLRTNDGAQA